MKDKFLGSLVGLAIGDAMGAPYEFKSAGYKVEPNYVTGGVHEVTLGEWTDDTSMALCLSDSLITDGFDPSGQMKRYLDWYHNGGVFCTRKNIFDIGSTVAGALDEYAITKEPYSGAEGDHNSGNGSLMRLAPIALMYHNNHEKLIEYAAKSSMTTHKSELAVDSCVVYAQLIAGALKGFSKTILLSKEFIDTNEIRHEVANIINGSYKEDKLFVPTGFVLDTLETALMAFHKFDNFEDGLLHVISLGEDTDTVGAVYGQLAGAYYGYENIDRKYIDGLQKVSLIESMANIFSFNSQKQGD